MAFYTKPKSTEYLSLTLDDIYQKAVFCTSLLLILHNMPHVVRDIMLVTSIQCDTQFQLKPINLTVWIINNTDHICDFLSYGASNSAYAKTARDKVEACLNVDKHRITFSIKKLVYFPTDTFYPKKKNVLIPWHCPNEWNRNASSL